MSRAPYVMPKPESAFERGTHDLVDTTLGWRFVQALLWRRATTRTRWARRARTSRNGVVSAAKTRTPSRLSVRGERQRRSPKAGTPNSWCDLDPRRKGDRSSWMPRATATDTSAEALARLKPAFREGGTATAGNSSGINERRVGEPRRGGGPRRSLGLRPMARILARPWQALILRSWPRPIPATRKALGRAGAGRPRTWISWC